MSYHTKGAPKKAQPKQTAQSFREYEWKPLEVAATDEVLRFIKSIFPSNLAVATALGEITPTANNKVSTNSAINVANDSHLCLATAKTEMVFGFNDVTKSLQKNELRLVGCVSNNPSSQSLLAHIPMMCSLSSPPVYLLPLNTTSGTLGRTFGLRTCLIFGITHPISLDTTKQSPNINSKVQQFCDKLISISQCTPPIMHWLQSMSENIPQLEITPKLKAIYTKISVPTENAAYPKKGIKPNLVAKAKRRKNKLLQPESQKVKRKLNKTENIEGHNKKMKRG